MKKIAYLFVILGLTPLFNAYSQPTMADVAGEWKTLRVRGYSDKIIYSEVTGSPYYNDNFIEGTVYMNNGNNISVPLRYDMYQDEMEFKRGDTVFWAPKKDIKFIRYGSDMLFVGMTHEDPSKLGYFFIAEAGDYTLYVKKWVEYYPDQPGKAYSESIPERFLRENDKYYLKVKGEQAKRITNKRVLKKLLKDNRAAIDFINRNKLKVDNGDDLMKLVMFLNNN